ncbi:unnamed protein product [Bursaphelenchus xylophilus]|uniref:(pine wood nematode) hypothetical protein n=1 Tax=Bursaphelenchus xylophilus TaxID=6326 RepID=A0A1I7SAT2_BURXY|nr:unnamed protein product [Bursaphelenchus xylophilus]CAG9126795.1 unnamed protein product [Bursaphelenchus xylophilus]
MQLFNLGKKKEKKKHKRKHGEENPEKNEKKDKDPKDKKHKDKKHKKHKRKSGHKKVDEKPLAPTPKPDPQKLADVGNLPAPKPSSPPKQEPLPYAATPKPSNQTDGAGVPSPTVPLNLPKEKPLEKPKLKASPSKEKPEKKVEKVKMPSPNKAEQIQKEAAEGKDKARKSDEKPTSGKAMVKRRRGKYDTDEPNFKTLRSQLVPVEPFAESSPGDKTPEGKTPHQLTPTPLPLAENAEKSAPTPKFHGTDAQYRGVSSAVTTTTSTDASGTTSGTNLTTDTSVPAGTSSVTTNSDPTTTPVITPQNSTPAQTPEPDPAERFKSRKGRIKVYNEDVVPEKKKSPSRRTKQTPEVIQEGKKRLSPLIEPTQEPSEEVPNIVPIDNSKKRIRDKYIEPTQTSSGQYQPSQRQLAVNINEVMRIATIMMKGGTDIQRRRSFDWLAEHRNSIHEERREAAHHLNLAIGDIPIARELAVATLRVLVDHGLVTEKEYRDHFAVIESAKEHQHITVSQLSHLVSTHAAYYNKKESE